MLTALRAILRTAARSLGVERAAAMAAINEGWAEIGGVAMAAHTKPAGLRGDVLWVDAEPGPWAQDLSGRRTQVIAYLNTLEGVAIREIRVRQRVGVYTARPTKPHPPATPEEPSLTPEELARIDQTVAEIRDAEVREAAKRAMVSQWRWRKRQQARSGPSR